MEFQNEGFYSNLNLLNSETSVWLRDVSGDECNNVMQYL